MKDSGNEQEVIVGHFVNNLIRNFYLEAKKAKQDPNNQLIRSYHKYKEGKLTGDINGKLNRWSLYR